MNVALNHWLLVGASALALLVSTNVSMASIGVPKGRPYYGSQNDAGFRSYRSYGPSYSAPSESRQSFSYEPGEDGNQPASGGCGCGSKAAAASESHDTAQKDGASDDTARQSYSYEPETSSDQGSMSRTVRRSGGTMQRDNWHYQKTDPRRTN